MQMEIQCKLNQKIVVCNLTSKIEIKTCKHKDY